MFSISDLTETIGTITFNNPEKQNALSKTLIEEFISALEDFYKHRGGLVIILEDGIFVVSKEMFQRWIVLTAMRETMVVTA